MSSDSGKIGRPLRTGSDLDAAREAILCGCNMYETACRSGISMYMFHRLRKELREEFATLKGTYNPAVLQRKRQT